MRQIIALILALLISSQAGASDRPPLMPDVRRDAMVAFWKFNEGSGTIAYDFVGGKNGTITNSPTYGPGLSGSALTFVSASSQYVQLANPPIVSGLASFTLNFWWKTTTTNNGCIYSEGNSADTNPLVAIFINDGATGDVALGYRDNAAVGADVVGPAISLNDGNWHMVTVTLNNRAHRDLFVDGVFRAANDVVTTGLTTDRANIGRFERIAPAAYIDSAIDQGGAWNVVLSTAEIKQLFNQRR